MKRFSVVLSLVFMLFCAGPVYAAGASYAVKKGDTLFSIARKHNVTIAELKKANGLKSQKLTAGMRLTIPAGDAARLKRAGSESSPAVHTVKKGETFRSISKKYALSVSELKEMNGIRKEARLKVGQKLIVKQAARRPNARNADEPDVYIVKRGDTVKGVARKFRMSSKELKELNGLEGNRLKPGQKLLLARMPAPQKAEPKPTPVSYSPAAPGPSAASLRLEEVKAFSQSDNLAKLGMKERLVLFAKKMLHLPYRFGGNGAFGLDCSAYVQKAYGLVGITIPRSAREQFSVGEAVDKEELSTGDLVFFRTYASFPSHVGIYIGNNLFIHASSLSKKITIDSLESPYYFQRYIGAKRLIPEEELEIEIDDEPAKEN